MTFEDFQTEVSYKTRFERYWYYGLSISVIAFGLFLLFKILSQPVQFHAGQLAVYAFVLFLFLLGASGFYLLPKRYKILTVDSTLTNEKKQDVLKRLLDMYNAHSNSEEQRYASFMIEDGFWKTPCKVYLFFDEEKFAFSLQTKDYADGGFIDFGRAERKRNELAGNIVVLSMEEIQAANSAFVK